MVIWGEKMDMPRCTGNFWQAPSWTVRRFQERRWGRRWLDLPTQMVRNAADSGSRLVAPEPKVMRICFPDTSPRQLDRGADDRNEGSEIWLRLADG